MWKLSDGELSELPEKVAKIFITQNIFVFT